MFCHLINLFFCSRREQLQQHWCSLDEPWAERADANDDAFASPHLHLTERSKEDEARGQLRGHIHHANRAASPSACASPAAATSSPPGCHWLQVQKHCLIAISVPYCEVNICKCFCWQHLVQLLLNYGQYEVMLNTKHYPTVPRSLGCWHRGNKLKPVSSKSGLACTTPRWGITCSKQCEIVLQSTLNGFELGKKAGEFNCFLNTFQSMNSIWKNWIS